MLTEVSIVCEQRPITPRPVPKNVGEILDSITGILQDDGKTLEDYRMERLEDRYGLTVAAIKEGDKMLANGTGERYTSVEALFEDLDN